MTDDPEPTDVGAGAVTELAAIADTLAEAARQVWASAADDPSPADLESFAIGIQIAQAHVSALLPDDWQTAGSASPTNPGAPPVRQVHDHPASVVELLIEAERTFRTLDLAHVDLIHDPSLAFELGELLREAQHVWR